MIEEKSVQKDIKAFITALKIPLIILGFIWFVKIYEYTHGVSFIRYGLYPRAIDGLLGILTSPFIHGSFDHLISNSFPLLFVSVMLVYFYRRVSIEVLTITWLATGVSVWLFARPAYHIGASGVLYGLLGFILFSGLFRRNSIAITLSLLTLAIYSGYFVGFEKKEGVSWESHMLGALVGLVTAFFFRGVKEPTEVIDVPSYGPSQRKPFFRPDTFEKTKFQRWLESQSHYEGE
jgi:membrane associated rhomboid family serine protease